MIRTSALRRALMLALMLGVALLMITSTGAAGRATCNKWASTKGSDDNRGTRTAPYRTLKKLSASLAAGQTGCLRAGSYGAGGTWTIKKGGKAGARVTFMSAPGERATIYNQTYLPNGTNFVTLKNLRFDGSRNRVGEYGKMAPLNITGDYNRVLSSHVTNRNVSRKKGGICIYLGKSHSAIAKRTLLRNNRVHDCGIGGNSHMHGIYVNWAHDSLIVGNYLYDISGKGIALYRSADRTVVRGNVVHGAGTDVLLGGGRDHATDGAVVRNNVLTYPRKNNEGITEWWQGRVGKGNKIYNNCLWPSGSIKPSRPSGADYRDNFYSSPDYIDASAANFTVTGDKCSEILRAGR